MSVIVNGTKTSQKPKKEEPKKAEEKKDKK